MIVRSYINKQILSTSCGVVIILMLIFIAQQAGRYINYAVSGKIAANILFPLLGAEIPCLLVILLPLSLYLSMFIVYSRLYADHEMAILYASGWNCGKFWLLSLPLIGFVACLVMIFACWLNPFLANTKEKIIAHGMTETNLLNLVSPKSFTVSGDGNRVLYVDKINTQQHKSENIFIVENKSRYNANYSADDIPEQTVIVASSAGPLLDKNFNRNMFVAQDGIRYQGIPGNNSYKILKFKEYMVQINDGADDKKNTIQEGYSMKNLYLNYNNPVFAGELQWRISLVLLPVVLSLLVLPFSKVTPRQSRYLLAVPVIIMYIIYVNLLLIAKHWVIFGVLPIYFGMWWVHGVFLAIAGWKLINHNNSCY